LLGREAAVDRERARDVGGIHAVFATRVDQQQVAVAQRVRVLVVVQDAAVRTAAHDRVIRDVRLVTVELVQQLRHDLVFRDAGPRRLHRADVRADRDLRRPPHHSRLGPTLVETHVVQRVIERDEFLWTVDAVLGLPLQRVHPADHALVELRMRTHRVVDAFAPLDQPGQDVVDVADRKRVVGAVVAHRAFGACATSVPGFARRVAIPHEEDVLGLLASGNQHRHSLGLVETRQVVEVAVGAIVVVDVAVALLLGRGRQDRDGALAHGLHQVPAAAGVLVFTQDHVRLLCSGVDLVRRSRHV
jgi:hypothetical protein